jgi:ABC-type dipeptide/oligopeptide/nickel transport system permease component
MGILIGILFGVPLGILAAHHHNRWNRPVAARACA